MTDPGTGTPTGRRTGPWRRGDLQWAAATAAVSAVLFAFSTASMGWVERLPLYFFLAATAILLAMPWLRRRFGEGRDRVRFDDTAIERLGAAGARERIGWQELALVAVVSSGPDGDSEPAYWLMLDASERRGCAIPAHAEGLDELLARVRTLDGFDHGAQARALADRRQQRFVLWRRRPAARPRG